MSDAWQSIKIRAFQHVPSGAGTSLLRVSGKSPWRRAASTRPVLRIDKAGDVHRFAALPSPEDPRGSLGAAYSAPTSLIVAESKFWLEHADGSLTELPMPVTGPGRAESDFETSHAGAPAGGDLQVPEASRGDGGVDELGETERRSDLLAKLAEQSRALARAEREAIEHEQARRRAENELARVREPQAQLAAAQPEGVGLQRELEALRAGRASLEQELDQSRDQLRIMTFERDELSRQATAFDGVAIKARERASKAEAENEQLRETISELEVWRGELERRLAAITSELGVAKAAREADERELKRLREALAEAETRDGPSTDASQTLAAQAAEIELLAAELASLRAEQSQARSPASERLSDQASARIARLEAERAELVRRAEQLTTALQDVLRPAHALLELARSGLEEQPARPTEDGADADLISRPA